MMLEDYQIEKIEKYLEVLSTDFEDFELFLDMICSSGLPLEYITEVVEGCVDGSL